MPSGISKTEDLQYPKVHSQSSPRWRKKRGAMMFYINTNGTVKPVDEHGTNMMVGTVARLMRLTNRPFT